MDTRCRGHTTQNLTNVVTYIAYAGGFATGNFRGMAIGKMMVLGYYVVQVITGSEPRPLTERLEGAGYGITVVDGYGRDGL